jgi:hypothetical protein
LLNLTARKLAPPMATAPTKAAMVKAPGNLAE